jgi:hypothetical protein
MPIFEFKVLSNKLIEIIYEIISESVKFEKRMCKLYMGSCIPNNGSSKVGPFLKEKTILSYS